MQSASKSQGVQIGGNMKKQEAYEIIRIELQRQLYTYDHKTLIDLLVDVLDDEDRCDWVRQYFESEEDIPKNVRRALSILGCL